MRAPYPHGVGLNLNFLGVNLGLGVFYVDAYTSFSFCIKIVLDVEYKANNHLLVSGDGTLSLPRRSECIRYLSSAIASEVIVCPITFTNGNYLLNAQYKLPMELSPCMLVLWFEQLLKSVPVYSVWSYDVSHLARVLIINGGSRQIPCVIQCHLWI